MAKRQTKTRTGTAHAHAHVHSKDKHPNASDSDNKEEMCCDGSGRTAEEHRHESADGKCCVDK